MQHKDFEEIEGRLKRREPLILGSTAAQRLSRRLPVEVISDPLHDGENDPHDDVSDVQKQLRGHQVLLFSKYMLSKLFCCLVVYLFIPWHAGLVIDSFIQRISTCIDNGLGTDWRDKLLSHQLCIV